MLEKSRESKSGEDLSKPASVSRKLRRKDADKIAMLEATVLMMKKKIEQLEQEKEENQS